jgi:hypothetical protein
MKNRSSFSLKIAVGQMERAPLELFKSAFGGEIYTQHRNGKKALLQWSVCRKELQRAFLATMTPLLRSKKQEAQIAVQFLDVMAGLGKGGQVKANPVLLAERERLHAACKVHKYAKDWRNAAVAQ